MRKALLLSTFFAGSVFATSPAFADDAPAAPAAPTPAFTITGSAAVVSQYRFRGISQSDNKPVVQGAFTVTSATGFYISTWGSSASANNAVNLGGTEIDVYGGYSKTLSGFTLDGGLYGYIYPGSTHAVGISESYYEVYGDVSKTYGPITAKAGINWAPNQSYFKDFNTATRHNVYVYGELGFAPTSFPIAFHSHLGHTAGGFDYLVNKGVKQYLDYTVGATYKWKALAFDLSVVGTNLSKSDTSELDNDFHRAAKTVLVGSITASF